MRAFRCPARKRARGRADFSPGEWRAMCARVDAGPGGADAAPARKWRAPAAFTPPEWTAMCARAGAAMPEPVGRRVAAV